MYNTLDKPEQIFLNFNANKIRWLSESKITPTNLFCIGSGENIKKLSLWATDLNSSKFEPRVLCESDTLDGECTELRAKNSEEIFLSTTNGSIYYFKFSKFDQKLIQVNKWRSQQPLDEFNTINSFDFNSDCSELCYVKENGSINFIRMHQTSNEPLYSFGKRDLCSLNSVLYLKQFEIAVSDSLGRTKIWDTRSRDNQRAALTLYLEGESSPILCMAKHPNQQHIIACGNSNGFLFIFDVRNSKKKPFVMSTTNIQPVMEVCFHPFSAENLISSSFDGSLWYWNANAKESLSNWEDRIITARNLLPDNRFALNSFDINNENILAVNNNYGLMKIKNSSSLI